MHPIKVTFHSYEDIIVGDLKIDCGYKNIFVDMKKYFL